MCGAYRNSIMGTLDSSYFTGTYCGNVAFLCIHLYVYDVAVTVVILCVHVMVPIVVALDSLGVYIALRFDSMYCL